jgi:hypothetical protein
VEENIPNPLPLLVIVLKETVGLGMVDHTIPLEVTGDPPSDITFPPLKAVFEDTLEKLVVTTVGSVETHIGFPSFPTVKT